jgi:hypothetical protein
MMGGETAGSGAAGEAAGPEGAPRAGTPNPGTPNLGAAQLPGPSGIGTGVAFDWALCAELIIVAVLFLAGRNALASPGMGTGMGMGMRGAMGMSRGLMLASAVALLVVSVPIFLQGEGLRRGRRWAWIIQVIFNALLIPVGLVSLPGAIAHVGPGHFGDLVVALVESVVSGVLVWLLLRPNTRAWVGTVTARAASARHSGRWIAWIVLYAIIGGAAIALNASY